MWQSFVFYFAEEDARKYIYENKMIWIDLIIKKSENYNYSSLEIF